MIFTFTRTANLILLCANFTAFAVAAGAPAKEGGTNNQEEAALTENFGWKDTNVAGQAAGEIGGTVTISSTPIYYADRIDRVGLAGKFKASGAICLPKQTETKTAVFVGWFDSRLKGWRFPTCVGFWVSGGNKPNDEVFTYALTGTWNGAAGAKPTGFRIPRDGSRDTWTLTFDPNANKGNGAVTFALDGQQPFVANLPPTHMSDDASFDRFGLLQAQASDDPLTLYVDDLQYDGKTQDFAADPGWEKGGGEPFVVPDFSKSDRARHANTAIPTGPITQDTLAERVQVEPNGALSFYTRNSENKLVKRLMITPEGSLVAGGSLQNGPDVPLTTEPRMLDPSVYDNATNGARLSWVNDFHFGLHKSAGLGKMQSEGQPMLQLRVLALMGRGDSPDIQLGRAGPDNGRTSYGPLEETPGGTALGKIIFKAYMKDPEKVEGEWTGDIAGIHARNTATPTKEKSPASLHFTTAGPSLKNNAWRENIERVVIQSNGYVGIGDEFNQPTERLHVQGNILAEGDIITRAGPKKFVIDHPLKKGKTLTHAAIEGPESAVYYRGEAQLVDGRAIVYLPKYFEALTLEQGRTVILTNVDGFDRLAIERQAGMQVKDGSFIVVSDTPTSSQVFTWEVKAARADVAPLDVEPESRSAYVELSRGQIELN